MSSKRDVLNRTLGKTKVGELSVKNLLPLIEISMEKYHKEENEWIPKESKMPDDHPVFEGVTDDVEVTDGKSWGFGVYNYKDKHWVYSMASTGEIETGNNITHWRYAPSLPEK